MFDKIMRWFGWSDEKKSASVFSRRRGRKIRPGSVQKPQKIQEAPIEYLINDMTTPDFKKIIMPPVPPDQPKFAVKDYQGGGFPLNSKQSRAAACYVTIANTMNFYNHHSEKPLPQWKGCNVLAVLPEAGTDLNAYYDRRSLRFFHFSHRRTGTVFTSQSADIVSHEFGHCVLDTFRPDTWGGTALEVWSFHEAFADLTSILHMLSHEEAIYFVIKQTKGDIRKDNIMSNLAEHVGQCIYKITDPQSGRNPHCLRNAINDFKYVDPGTLPENAPDNKLAAECHSFGRVFLGAFYDILVMLYEDAKIKGMTSIDALRLARNILTLYVLKAIQNAPLNTRFYESMAKTILWADVTLKDRLYHDRIRNIFVRRNILPAQEIKMLSSAPQCDDSKIVTSQSIWNTKLSDHFLRSQSNHNPLYDVELAIPNEEAYLYDNEHHAIDVIGVSEEDTLRDAESAIAYLYKSGNVSPSSKTPFEIQNGKLVRTHFS